MKNIQNKVKCLTIQILDLFSLSLLRNKEIDERVCLHHFLLKKEKGLKLF
jgi:hypothetical protein